MIVARDRPRFKHAIKELRKKNKRCKMFLMFLRVQGIFLLRYRENSMGLHFGVCGISDRVIRARDEEASTLSLSRFLIAGAALVLATRREIADACFRFIDIEIAGCVGWVRREVRQHHDTKKPRRHDDPRGETKQARARARERSGSEVDISEWSGVVCFSYLTTLTTRDISKVSLYPFLLLCPSICPSLDRRTIRAHPRPGI